MPPRATLSVSILTYNEERRVRPCLESVRWADEIVVLDSYSTDQTLAICAEYGAKIFQRTYVHGRHFEARQYAAELATGDWVLCLDADEHVSPELAADIHDLLEKNDPTAVGYSLRRRVFFLGRWIDHGTWGTRYLVRLVRRGTARFVGNAANDQLVVDGKVVRLNGYLRHDAYRCISDQMRQIDTIAGAFVDYQMEESGSPRRATPWTGLWHGVMRFFHAYIWRRGFLDGRAGLYVAVTSSFYSFIKYAKLWEARNASAWQQEAPQPDENRPQR